MKTCNCLALWGAIFGICGGVVVSIPATFWWMSTSPMHWYTLLVAAPFFGGIWGAFGGFVAGIVPPSALKRTENMILLMAFAGAIGGGGGGLAFGQLIDKGQGLATPIWVLIAALTGALCAVLASVRGVCALSTQPAQESEPWSNLDADDAKVPSQEIFK